MNVLITGGAGYVGTELLVRLALNKEITKITIYDNLSRGHRSLFLGTKVPFLSKIEFVHGEILDSRLLKKKLIDTDVLIHLAAIVTTPFANTDPHFYEQVNHWGTAEVVYAAEESGVSKFIHLSSTAVYGTGADLADESTLPLPQTYYGISKLRGEAHVNRPSYLEEEISMDSAKACALMRSSINSCLMPILPTVFKYSVTGSRPELSFM